MPKLLPKSESERESVKPDICQSCRYYLEYEDLNEMDLETPDDLTGICRRYPPAVYPGLTPLSVSPDVPRNGWCGEYMPK